MQGSQPNSGQGQVMFYDPTKFQKGATDFPPVSSSVQQNHSEPASTAGFYNDQGVNTATSSSWNSWGAWDPNSAAYNNLGQVPADGTQVTTDSVYGQQWYGHNQWDANQMVWDPSTQQWVPNQFNYQQNDPNFQQGGVSYQQNDVNYQQGQESQFGGYNRHWTANGAMNGQNNLSYNSNYHFADTATGQGEAQSNFGTQNAGTVSGDNLQQQVVGVGAPIEGDDVEDTDEHTEDNTEELDESQSTEPTTETESSDNQSLNRSLGNYEEGYLDGYVQNEEVIHENESNSVETAGQVAKSESNFVENYSIDGAAMSGQGSNGFDISGQMQVLSLENVPHEHIPGDKSVEKTNMYNPNSSQISYQQQLYSVPKMPETSVNTGNPPQIDTVTLSNTTEPVMSFSDWEMVPPTKTFDVPTMSQDPQVPLSVQQRAPAASHSRNTSMDDNVHFFIGSNASSTRVSPAQSTKTDDGSGSQRSGVSNSAGQTGDKTAQDMAQNRVPAANQRQEADIAVSEEMLTPVIATSNSAPPQPGFGQPSNSLSHPPVQAPPPNIFTGPPPVMSGSAMAGNPYRKSPLTDSVADNSVLSSTRLDVTKPNSDNSPVVLNRSISPIPSDHMTDKPDLNADIAVSKSEPSVVDTPRTSGSQKPTRIPESPVMPRKESPFQPPGRSKPVKASHDIIVSANPNSEDVRENLNSRRDPDHVRNGSDRSDKSGDRQNPDKEVSRRTEGRRTPDWDSRRSEGRRTPDWDRRRDDRGYGRRTPDWDSREDRHSRDPERDRYRRHGDEDGGDRLTSRPPRPGNGNDRGHSSRPRQSAFHQIQSSRSKNNVSPATSLWDTPDNLSTVSNILLVPQATNSSSAPRSQGTTAPSVLTPVASLITSMSEHIKTEDSDSKRNDQDEKTQGQNSFNETKDRAKDRDSGRQPDRGGNRDDDDRGLRGNRSYESLRDKERSFKDSRNDSREKLSMYSSRNSLDQDDPRERSRRGDSRERERGYRDKDYYSDRYR